MVNKDFDFEELLKNYDYSFRKGDLVKGVVCGYDSQGVMVDIGAKTYAVVPLKEAVSKDEKVEEKFVKGNEYEFLIIREEDEEGKFLLSGKRVAVAYAWKELEKAKAEDQVILGLIDGIVKGGLLINVSGVQGFVPSSQLKGKETLTFIIGMVFTVLMAFSRMSVGAHYLTDVSFGALFMIVLCIVANEINLKFFLVEEDNVEWR